MLRYRNIGGAPGERHSMTQYLKEHKIEVGCSVAIAALVATILAGWFS
jgi:hypothetical protein